MKKKFKPDIKLILGLGIGFIVALVVSLTSLLGVFDEFELNMLDIRFKALNEFKQKPDDRIVIVGVDELSVALTGRWPWKREEDAKIVDFLNLYGAKAILFDVFFSYRDENYPESDEKFVEAVKNAGNVYIASRFIPVTEEHQQDMALLKNSKMASNNVLDYFELPTKQATELIPDNKKLGYQLPFDGLEQAAKSYGTVHVGTADDDQVRYQDFIYEHDGSLYTSLSMAFALSYLKDNNLLKEKRKLPVDEKNRVIINWKAEKITEKTPEKNQVVPPYRQYSAWRLTESWESLEKASQACGLPPQQFKEMLDNPEGFENIEEYIEKIPEDFELYFDGHNPTELFKDKIVLIGIASTATTVRDVVSNPFFKEIPGVYVLANAIDNFIHNDFLSKVSKPLTILIIFALGVFSSFSIFCFKDSLFGVLMPVVVAFLYILATVFAFVQYNYWVDIFYTELTIAITFAISASIYYIIEGREKIKIKQAMSNYVAPQVMNEVLSEPSKLKLGGTRKELTILFSDIKGFTTISENNSPEDVVSMLNEYFDLMVHIVLQNQGTFDKFIGDAIMAFWNAPLDVEDHAFLAVKTSCEMQKAVDILCFKWGMDYEDFSIRVGINTAEVIVGNVGSDKIKDYTVIGDGVNIASRLEGLNKEYGTKIIISEYTYLKIKDRIGVKYLGESKLKGKDKLINVYEVINIKE